MSGFNEAADESTRVVGDGITDWAKRKRSKLQKAALVKEVSNARWLTTKVPDVFRARFPHLFAGSGTSSSQPPNLPGSPKDPG